jgi:general secretion pathway protein M
VAVGLLAAVIIVLYAAVVTPLVGLYTGYEEEIADLDHRIAQYRRVAANVPALRKALADLDNRRETTTYYLKNTRPTLATAELQSYVESLITRNGGKLVSTQVVPEDKDQRFPRSAIRVNLRGSVDSLRDLLYALESGRPLVFIESLTVTTSATRVVRRRQRTGVDAPEVLSISIDAVAYRRDDPEAVES